MERKGRRRSSILMDCVWSTSRIQPISPFDVQSNHNKPLSFNNGIQHPHLVYFDRIDRRQGGEWELPPDARGGPVLKSHPRLTSSPRTLTLPIRTLLAVPHRRLALDQARKLLELVVRPQELVGRQGHQRGDGCVPFRVQGWNGSGCQAGGAQREQGRPRASPSREMFLKSS